MGGDPSIQLTTFPGGMSALAHMQTLGEYIPNLILLAGRFPITQMVALEVLIALKADKQLCYIPVVVISGADTLEIIHGFYDNHAACVVELPHTLAQLVPMLAVMKSFWLEIAVLPGKGKLFYE